MSKEALMEKVKDFIDAADDTQLWELEHFVEDTATTTDYSDWNSLPDILKNRLELSREQSRNGEGIPHEEVMNHLKQWRENYLATGSGR